MLSRPTGKFEMFSTI